MASSHQLDQLDHQILSYLIENARTPFTEIARKLIVATGTVHARVRKLEEAGIIRGASLRVNYQKLGYDFIAYIGLYLDKTSNSVQVIEALRDIPEVTVANMVSGQYGILCKIRARDTAHARDVIYTINDLPGVVRSESMISLEECINSSDRLLRDVFGQE